MPTMNQITITIAVAIAENSGIFLQAINVRLFPNAVDIPSRMTATTAVAAR